mmetsp:Transcript_29578/g.50218  ORF Transcript_29578/g.50218 Transcript_29578/m.50218 type:complete len:234 (+) Transcript_29578:2963-3664(+)
MGGIRRRCQRMGLGIAGSGVCGHLDAGLCPADLFCARGLRLRQQVRLLDLVSVLHRPPVHCPVLHFAVLGPEQHGLYGHVLFESCAAVEDGALFRIGDSDRQHCPEGKACAGRQHFGRLPDLDRVRHASVHYGVRQRAPGRGLRHHPQVHVLHYPLPRGRVGHDRLHARGQVHRRRDRPSGHRNVCCAHGYSVLRFRGHAGDQQAAAGGQEEGGRLCGLWWRSHKFQTSSNNG